MFGLALGLASAALVAGVASAALLSDEARPSPRNASAPQEDGFELEPLTAKKLNTGIVRLAVALRPTATPTATPTPHPTAVPPPVEPSLGGSFQSAEPETCAASMDGLALAVFDAMNAERVRQGLPSLIAHSCATYVARARSRDMASAGYLAHTSPDGDSWSSLLAAYGVSYAWAGENIARNSYPGIDAASATLDAFMSSSGHRENILNTHFSHVGVAVVTDALGVNYFAVVFLGF